MTLLFTQGDCWKGTTIERHYFEISSISEVIETYSSINYVQAVCLDRNGDVVLTKNKKHLQSKYSLPGGKIENDGLQKNTDSIIKELDREIQEEIGYKIDEHSPTLPLICTVTKEEDSEKLYISVAFVTHVVQITDDVADEDSLGGEAFDFEVAKKKLNWGKFGKTVINKAHSYIQFFNTHRREKSKIAILLPVYNELEETLQESISNLHSQMRSLYEIADPYLLIGINGEISEPLFEKVKVIIEEIPWLSRRSKVFYTNTPGKARMQNILANWAQNFLRADYLIGTDTKVFREKNSFITLYKQFLELSFENSKLMYLGGTILPYPIEKFKINNIISDEEELFYNLLEADKTDLALKYFPKEHLRGGLYITNTWVELIEDVEDDYQINRKIPKEYGNDSIKLTTLAKGYVTPRMSFSDYFATRLKRQTESEKKIRTKYSQYFCKRKKTCLDPVTLQDFKARDYDQYLLFLAKKTLDQKIKEIICNIETIEDGEAFSKEELNMDSFLSSLRSIGVSKSIDKLLSYYEPVIKAMGIDTKLISFGYRDKKHRGFIQF